MTQCIYERIGDGKQKAHRYQCGECGHQRESDYPPERLHRRCGAPPTYRQRAERAVADLVAQGVATRSLDEINATLDKCFAGCSQMDGGYCRLRGSECRTRENWLLYIVVSDCDPVLPAQEMGISNSRE